MNPICNECNVEMRCRKNGVTVAPKDNPQWIRKGDMFKCPECGNEVLSSLGDPFHDGDINPDVILKEALPDALVDIIQKPVDFSKFL